MKPIKSIQIENLKSICFSADYSKAAVVSQRENYNNSLFRVLFYKPYTLSIYNLTNSNKQIIAQSWNYLWRPSFSHDMKKVVIISMLDNVKVLLRNFLQHIKKELLKKQIPIEPTTSSTMKVFDIETRKVLTKKDFYKQQVLSAFFHDHDKQLILTKYSFEDGIYDSVEVWDFNLNHAEHSLETSPPLSVPSSVIASNDDLIATITVTNLHLGKLSDKKFVTNLDHVKDQNGKLLKENVLDAEFNVHTLSYDAKVIAISFYYFSPEKHTEDVCILNLSGTDIISVKSWCCPYFVLDMALSTEGDYLAVLAEIPEENKISHAVLLYDTNSAKELLRYVNNELVGIKFSTKDELILYSDSEISFYSIEKICTDNLSS